MPALSYSRVFTEKIFIKFFRQCCCTSVSVEPKPSIFINDHGVLTCIGIIIPLWNDADFCYIFQLLQTVSLLASHITTLGWFHRSCIHSAYSLTSSSACNSLGQEHHPVPPYQIGNSSWIRNPSSSAMRYHSSGGNPIQ